MHTSVGTRPVLAVLLLLPLAALSGAEQQQQQQHIVYVHSGNVKAYHALSILQARRSHPEANITIIVDVKNGGSIEQWQKPAAAAGAKIYVPRDYSMVDHFKQRYVSASVNSYQYELFCFYRHLLVYQFMQAKDVSSAVALDLDILLYSNVFDVLSEGTTQNYIGTWATHWTKSSIQAFVNYQLGFYAKDRVEVAKQIAQVGTAMSKELTEQHRPSWWPQGVAWRHMSDMYMLKDFMLKKPGFLKARCESSDGCKHLRPMANVKKVIGDACDADLTKAFDWKFDQQQGLWQPYLVNTDTLVPGLHFQGECKKLIPTLACHNTVGCGFNTRWCPAAAAAATAVV